MLTTVNKFKFRVGLTDSPYVGMREALQWMLFGRLSVLFIILFTLLTKNIVAKFPVDDLGYSLGLSLLVVSFSVTCLQASILDKITVNWTWVMGQIIFDSAVSAFWILNSGHSESIFPLFYLVQILVVSLTFFQRGAWIASLVSVISLGIGTFFRSSSQSEIFFLWAVYSAIFVLLGLIGGFLSEELRRTSEKLKMKTVEVEQLTAFQERIISELPTGLLTVDHEMNLNFINPAAEHILGLLARDSVGKPLAQVSSDLMPFFSQLESQDIFEDEVPVGGPETSVSATGSEFHRTVFLKTKSETGGQARLQQTVELGSGLNKRTLRGDVADIDVEAGVGRLLRNQAQGGRVLLFQDVTKLVHLEEKLKQNEKLAAVGQLAAGIAHEIRNPLASMSASIEMLKTAQEWTDPENQRLMEIALKEIDRLNGLISEFLDFVKPERFKVSPIALEPILKDIVTVASGMKEVKEVAEIRIQMTPCLVLANEEKIRQVVWNLLLNSVQAINRKGWIEVGCEPLNSQRVKWWVSDSGLGMKEEVLAHIYEPFFTTKPKGTGLGLPTVHKIIEAHHGEIKVTSTYGKGTCFEIFLPRA
jgi:two-component system, NtrC family, sensor histidine kinase PilS